MRKTLVTKENIKQLLDSLWQAGVRKDFHGSLDEWNALSIDERNKFNAYFINTETFNPVANGALFMPGCNNSANFVNTKARWIDGKYIWKKTYKFTSKVTKGKLNTVTIKLPKDMKDILCVEAYLNKQNRTTIEKIQCLYGNVTLGLNDYYIITGRSTGILAPKLKIHNYFNSGTDKYLEYDYSVTIWFTV